MTTHVIDKDGNQIRLSHYEDHVAFFYGKISATTASLVTFFMTSQFAFLVTTLCMLSIMLADVSNIRFHRKLINGESTNYDRWKQEYTFLSTAFMLVTGIWCFFTFLWSENPFLHLLCVATAMGNVLNLICRNFNDDRILTLQLIGVGGPLIMGVLSYGDFRSMILCGFFLPLFSGIRDMSSRLRSLYSDVTAESQQREAFGMQLNEALESMSHGLLMFDDEMRLRVVNRTARDILGIDSRIDCFGKPLTEIALAVDARCPEINRVRILEEALLKRLQQRTQSKVFQVAQDQYMELSIKLRESGGCVLVIEDVTQRIQYQNRINQLARYDDLTGLCNRNYFGQQTETILGSLDEDSEAALLFFDLDNFKRINDLLGHEAGDFILASVAERARAFLPKGAIIGRYGGDEFVAFLQAKDCKPSIEEFCNSLIKSLTKPLDFNNQRLKFGSSLGIARFPEHGQTVESLIKRADLALYESKNSGKNTHTFFTPQMENSLHERLELEQDLTKAVRQGRLELHFQPIVSMETHRPAIFEALTRWKRNGLEQVSPAKFIPVAEDLGLIREIGEWTLLEACRQCAKWPSPTSVAVNVSAVQFQVGSITEAVAIALEATGLDPARLEIEITETAVLNDMSHAAFVLEKLSEMGVRISLDDFGTGYSSLSYLHKLPLDKLKIDKSFIDDLIESERSQTLLKGITAMGKALDLKLVVEGIENQQQFDLLRDRYAIDYVQGYYFSKPMPENDAIEFARHFNPEQEPEEIAANQNQVA